MTNPPKTATYLLPRVHDIVRLRLRDCRASLFTAEPLPSGFQFEGGRLCGAPALQDVCLSPSGCGACLRGQLCLPLCLCLICGCSRREIFGSVRLPIEAALRTSPCAPLQFVAQADVSLRDAQPLDGCLCVCFDLMLTLYAACLCPAQLPAACPPPCCAPDCAPFFDLPLFPELRPPRR